MKIVHLLVTALIACAGAAWAQTEIEKDLDGNASVFQTTPGVPSARR
jgi:hypothetical protein